MQLNEVLKAAIKRGASDIHFKATLPALCRINGGLHPIDDQRLAPEELARCASSIMTAFQKERFKQTNDLDMSYSVPTVGRFRVNVFQQRGMVGMVFRIIPLKIASISELRLPKILEDVAMEHRGLVLVTGTTGSGKSTTLAALIDQINKKRSAHVMTVEDPIEFIFTDKRSIVNQREVGVDTVSFGQALKAALRQDPDVILVGEMRDLETTDTAITAAETGHLVMSTVHTLDAPETINRIVSIFPPHQQKQIRLQLGATLRAIVSQRLVPTADGRGRIAALEILRDTPRIRELIEDKDRLREISEAIAQGHTTHGMQTFDQSLMSHLKSKRITYEEALRQATHPSNFALRVSGIESTTDSKWDAFEGEAGNSPQRGSGPPRKRSGTQDLF